MSSRAPRAPTLADVARRAGVSVTTASFALSGRFGGEPSGSEHTKAKVREAAEELGYVPNRNARAMRIGRSDSIVLALGWPEDPWGASLTSAVADRGLEQGKSTLVLADERWYEFLSGGHHDCSFITSVDFSPEGPQLLHRLAKGAGGIVAFSERLEPESFDVVHSSADAAIGEAYRTLRSRHREVSLFTPLTIAQVAERSGPSRVRVYQDVARRAGDDPVGGIRPVGSASRMLVLQEAVRWLSAPDRPSAVICSSGYLALALQAAANHLSLRVPEDLEFIAIGDVPAESLYLEPISYYGVRDVFDRMSRIIVDRAMVRNRAPGTMHRLTWEFFPGATTRDDAVSGP